MTKTHGMRYSEQFTYQSWRAAKGRCFNPNDPAYPRYGGRGISMCSEWSDDFSAFFRDMGRRPAEMTLDRIDFDGDYEPGNCRWATVEEQANNTPLNVRITHDGETLTVAQWSRRLGINRATIDRRLAAGKPISDVLAPHTLSRNKVPLRLADRR